MRERAGQDFERFGVLGGSVAVKVDSAEIKVGVLIYHHSIFSQLEPSGSLLWDE
jgi:hypothetical protein